MSLNVRRYDENTKRIFLDSRYLFSFSTNDGFSERALNAQILIDYDYNLVFDFACNLPTANKYALKRFEETTTQKASPEIIILLEDLLSHDYLCLKEWYDCYPVQIDDIGGQQFLINFNSPTFNIHIMDGLPKEEFTTFIEQKLYDFNFYLKSLVEAKYDYLGSI